MEASSSNQPAASQLDHGKTPLREGRSHMGIASASQHIHPVTSDGSIGQESSNSHFFLPSCRSARRQLSLISAASSTPSNDDTFPGPTIDATTTIRWRSPMEHIESSGPTIYDARQTKQKMSIEPTKSPENLTRATPSIPAKARRKRKASMDLAKAQADSSTRHGSTKKTSQHHLVPNRCSILILKGNTIELSAIQMHSNTLPNGSFSMALYMNLFILEVLPMYAHLAVLAFGTRSVCVVMVE